VKKKPEHLTGEVNHGQVTRQWLSWKAGMEAMAPWAKDRCSPGSSPCLFLSRNSSSPAIHIQPSGPKFLSHSTLGTSAVKGGPWLSASSSALFPPIHTEHGGSSALDKGHPVTPGKGKWLALLCSSGDVPYAEPQVYPSVLPLPYFSPALLSLA
jgi:hypothetical protein